MPRRGLRPRRNPEPNAALAAYARRLARAEALTRVACVASGLVLAAGAAALLFGVMQLGTRAVVGAVIGALVVLTPAWLLLRRGFTGRDVDRYDLQAFADSNPRVRWW